MAQKLTTNQLVAYNLARIRKMRGFSQEQAAEVLAPYVGRVWSKAVYSAAERSIDGKRVRQFTADDLTAFSLAFGVPVLFFFLPVQPEDRDRYDLEGLECGGQELAWRDLWTLIGGGDFRSAIFTRILELPAEERPNRVMWAALQQLTFQPPAVQDFDRAMADQQAQTREVFEEIGADDVIEIWETEGKLPKRSDEPEG